MRERTSIGCAAFPMQINDLGIYAGRKKIREKKKEVKETLTSLKALTPIREERHHPEEVVLLLLGCFLSCLLGSLLGYFLRRFLLGGHLITSLRALDFYWF
ncbi:MAG: hypothetical protein JF616_14930 [Fibrobacteres bacterium]|jgi:hypothetical protein|nr:hypothetical protein [Fibrobacterota bacterium]